MIKNDHTVSENDSMVSKYRRSGKFHCQNNFVVEINCENLTCENLTWEKKYTAMSKCAHESTPPLPEVNV